MQLTIRFLEGSTVVLDVVSSMTGLELKQRISEAKPSVGSLEGTMKLIFAGKILDDAVTLAQAGVEKDSCIHCIVPLENANSATSSKSPLAEPPVPVKPISIKLYYHKESSQVEVRRFQFQAPIAIKNLFNIFQSLFGVTNHSRFHVRYSFEGEDVTFSTDMEFSHMLELKRKELNPLVLNLSLWPKNKAVGALPSLTSVEMSSPSSSSTATASPLSSDETFPQEKVKILNAKAKKNAKPTTNLYSVHLMHNGQYIGVTNNRISASATPTEWIAQTVGTTKKKNVDSANNNKNTNFLCFALASAPENHLRISEAGVVAHTGGLGKWARFIPIFCEPNQNSGKNRAVVLRNVGNPKNLLGIHDNKVVSLSENHAGTKLTMVLLEK